MERHTDLERIPAGARVTRSYWAIPTYYGTGSEHATEIEALEVAIARGEAHPGNTVTIDLRWSMSWERHSDANPSVGQDFVASRSTYASLAEAKEALERLRRFSSPPFLAVR